MTKSSICERKREGERDHKMAFSLFLIVPVLPMVLYPHSGSVFPLSSYFLEKSSQTHPEVLFFMSQFNELDNIES